LEDRIEASARVGELHSQSWDLLVNRIPWWAVASAAAGCALLAGGLTLAQALQPPGYNPVRDTISALAAYKATDRWVMTSALAGLGACHVITAMGLRPARHGGRIVFAVGGLATLMVAAFAQPVHGSSSAHIVAATIAFTALAVWPVLAARRGIPAPLLTVPGCVMASAVLVGLVLWFAAEVHGNHRGLAERATAGAETVWPLVVVVTSRRALARAVSRR
jgi:hypothetical membrane protein